MKNRLLLIGIISLTLVFGVVLTGCDSDSGAGTVIVNNTSSKDDVFITICNADTIEVLSGDFVDQGIKITFTNVPTGTNLAIVAIDTSDAEAYSSIFTVSKNQTRKFDYNGSSTIVGPY